MRRKLYIWPKSVFWSAIACGLLAIVLHLAGMDHQFPGSDLLRKFYDLKIGVPKSVNWHPMGQFVSWSLAVLAVLGVTSSVFMGVRRAPAQFPSPDEEEPDD